MDTSRSISISGGPGATAVTGAVFVAVEVSSKTGLYSSKSYTLFMNADPDVHPFQVSQMAEDIREFNARILGRAHDLEGDFDSTSQEFSDILQWNIQKEADLDLGLWMEVASSVSFCAAVTENWADEIKEYKDERLRIINRWNEEAPELAKGLDEAPPFFSFITSKSPAEAAEAELEKLKEDLQREEMSAYRKMKDSAEQLSDDLRDGPTPEAIERLIQGKYINWSHFNLGGDIESIPIEMEPDEAAAVVIEFSENPNNYEGDIDEVTAILNNMGLVAMDKQRSGEDLTDAEIIFLEKFYESLEEAADVSDTPPGVLAIINDLSMNGDLDNDLREEVVGSLGNGVLILSDESIGGGYDLLPESIRSASEGTKIDPELGTDYLTHNDWVESAEALALMMENSLPELQGGQQYSVNLTQSVAHAIEHQISLDGESEDQTYLPLSETALESLVFASTRNEDANVAILSGEGDYEHPVHGIDTGMTLKALYMHDWPEGSEAVTGLTDWIWEQYKSSDEADRLRAAEGVEALLEALTLQDEKSGDNVFLDTGIRIDGNANAAVTEINPELAESFSKIFMTYIDSFAIQHDDSGAEVLSAEDASPYLFFGEGDIPVLLSDEARENFIQIVVANEEAVPSVMFSAVDYGNRALEESIFNTDHSPTPYGNSAGYLRDLIDSALVKEHNARAALLNSDSPDDLLEKSEQEAIEKTQKQWDMAYSVISDSISGGVGMLPVVGGPGGTLVDILSTVLEEPLKNSFVEDANARMEEISAEMTENSAASSASTYRHDMAQWQIELDVARILLERDVISLEEFEGTNALVDRGNGPSLPFTPSEWGSNFPTRSTDLREVLYDSVPDSSVSRDSIEQIMEEYIEAYLRSYKNRTGEAN